MELKRGDVVTVVTSGDYGKPRPALVIQSNAFSALPSVTVLRLTSDLRDWPLFRVTVQPDTGNGLKKTSQIMIDKAAAVPKAKIGSPIGHVDPAVMQSVSKALVRFLGLQSGITPDATAP